MRLLPVTEREEVGPVHASIDPAEQPRHVMELLRGLAILGVIAVHTSAHFPQAGGLSPVVLTGMAIDAVSHYAVPLFILLSGMALAMRYAGGLTRGDLGPFCRRRLLRIIPPYVIFSLVYLGVF